MWNISTLYHFRRDPLEKQNSTQVQENGPHFYSHVLLTRLYRAASYEQNISVKYDHSAPLSYLHHSTSYLYILPRFRGMQCQRPHYRCISVAEPWTFISLVYVPCWSGCCCLHVPYLWIYLHSSTACSSDYGRTLSFLSIVIDHLKNFIFYWNE